jgi:uncharacterized membrane protein
MPTTSTSTQKMFCQLCGGEFLDSACTAVALVRPNLAEFVARRHPDNWRSDGCICPSCLGGERAAYLMDQLERERGQLTALEADIARKAAEHKTIASHLELQFEERLTLGQRLADAVATVGGSWPFLLGFAVVIAAWILLNSTFLRMNAFDPYPYIFLNLVLSCLAAIQAPIIMMSQNRQAARDRLEADEDYRVNLKAELEVATLHEKMDHLLHVQWERMVEIQQTQLELLNELVHRRNEGG